MAWPDANAAQSPVGDARRIPCCPSIYGGRGWGFSMILPSAVILGK